jgi:hypothetical protein
MLYFYAYLIFGLGFTFHAALNDFSNLISTPIKSFFYLLALIAFYPIFAIYGIYLRVFTP